MISSISYVPWPPHDGTSSGEYVGDFSTGGLGGTGGLIWKFGASMVVNRAKDGNAVQRWKFPSRGGTDEMPRRRPHVMVLVTDLDRVSYESTHLRYLVFMDMMSRVFIFC